jgi:hypothetical protein
MGRMARLFVLAGLACLCRGSRNCGAHAAACGGKAAEDEEPGHLARRSNSTRRGTLNIEWSGPIEPGMADYLRTAIDNYGTASHRVVLFLNSAGARSTRATTSFTSSTRSNQRTGLSPRCCTASCAPPCAYPSSSKAIRIGSKGSCPSLSARTSGNPAAISSAQRPASSCIRCRKDTERASRTMTRNIDQVEVNVGTTNTSVS